MSIQNRESFLNNLAGRLHRPRRTQGVSRPDWSVYPQYDVLKGITQDELVEVLEKQCEAIHTDFIHTDRKGLPKLLEETIRNYNGKSMIVSNDSRNEEYGLSGLYKDLDRDLNVHIWDPRLGKGNQVIAEQADVGITFSDITLAESATVTLFNNKNNGRSISLLPKTYIAIIPKSTLVPRMTQAANQIHEATMKGEEVASYVSFISGPSNSADIEMNLIVGVHGPIKATYILVD
ncbi:lactate utilization protein C [Oceanobacillus sp. Castelsardo]|uniref:LutC/YkgG family protein n=1 Tax=Oceanobacillus sp. Castelsardo TaxID=1851204 RepID=UPI000839227A|nr:lactate utilization protein C [Oceanobacillus sp. Castelsardo]